MKKKNKYSIASELNILKTNGTASFDLTKVKYSVISSTIQRIQNDNYGSRFEMEKIDNIVKVTKVK